MHAQSLNFFFFFFNDTATTEIYTLSLHDALPIYRRWVVFQPRPGSHFRGQRLCAREKRLRSEEHTSELQSHLNLVCRLLLEKKKKKQQAKAIETAESMTTNTTSLLPPPTHTLYYN